MLFSHGIAVALVAAALWGSSPAGTPGAASEPRRRDYFAGLCLGFALASEFTAGRVVLGFFAVLDLPVRWVEDADSRVRIVRTEWQDLRGMLRLLRTPASPPISHARGV
jgi:hypothetical protein